MCPTITMGIERVKQGILQSSGIEIIVHSGGGFQSEEFGEGIVNNIIVSSFFNENMWHFNKGH
jgi:hypothetical protein